MSILTKIGTFIETYSAGVIAATISTGFAVYMVINGQVKVKFPDIVVRHNPVNSPLNGKLANSLVPKQSSSNSILPSTVDQIVTGSLPQVSSHRSGQAAKQNFFKLPANQLDSKAGRYILRIATKEIALVEGRGKLWSVRPGRLLPGSGRVLRIVQRGKKWVVVTSHGEISP